MENQYLEVAEVVAALEGALARGVELILLLPAVPELASSAPVTQERLAFLKPVYVHSKLMLIDDEWATVGSCNLHHYSLFGNGELNAAIWDPAAVRALRIELFQKHDEPGELRERHTPAELVVGRGDARRHVVVDC